MIVFNGFLARKNESTPANIKEQDTFGVSMLTAKQDASPSNEEWEWIEQTKNGHPLAFEALYKKHCLDRCLSLLQQGERRLRIALNEFKVKTIDLKEDLYPYTKNINTPTHFKEIENEINH